MTLELMGKFPCLFSGPSPDSDREVVGGRGKVIAAGRPCDRPHRSCVAGQRREAKPVFGWIVDVKLDRIVVGRRRKNLSSELKSISSPTFWESENNLLCRMPRDTFDVLAMFHHDAHAFEIRIWLDWGEGNQSTA